VFLAAVPLQLLSPATVAQAKAGIAIKPQIRARPLLVTTPTTASSQRDQPFSALVGVPRSSAVAGVVTCNCSMGTDEDSIKVQLPPLPTLVTTPTTASYQSPLQAMHKGLTCNAMDHQQFLLLQDCHVNNSISVSRSHSMQLN
jgi:hypothetical protein